MVPATDVALPRRPARRPLPFSRAAFRARLDGEPRRWVLALAAAEGLVGCAMLVAEKFSSPGPGYLLVVPLAFAVFAPLFGVLALYACAQPLHWAGRILGSRATPVEVRAALAWSQTPTIIIGWPAVLLLFTRIAVAESEPVPGALQFLHDTALALTRWSQLLVPLGSILGLLLYARYLSEAQRLEGIRAVLGHALAVVLGFAVLAAGMALVWALSGA